MSDEDFDAKLEELLGEMSAGAILQIPGVYEAVAEELNNAVLDALDPLVEDDEVSALNADDIPADYPVQPLRKGEAARSKSTCGTCGLSWDDGVSTSMTPVPGARCPFEAFHKSDE